MQDHHRNTSMQITNSPPYLPKGLSIWMVRGLGIAAVTALLAFSAPLVWAAVSAGAGIAALCGMAAVGFAAFQALPLAAQKLENQILAMRKAEARKSPIEQLQNEMLRRAQRLKSFRSALVTVGGQIESIEEMIEERRRRDPGQSLERQERALMRLKQFHGVNLNRLVQAQAALEEFRMTIQRKESEWRIALAIGDANEMLDPNATDNLMQDLLTDTALRTVQDRFNNVFAELDVQMSGMNSPTRSLLDAENLDHLEALNLPTYTAQRSH
jgi:hypothetical protein